MKIKSKLILAVAFTSLTVLNLSMQADAKEDDTSKDKSPKIQNVEVDHRNYDKKSSDIQKEVAKTSTAAMSYVYSLEGKGWDFDGYYG